jgi:cytochrome c-type biogenesis protein
MIGITVSVGLAFLAGLASFFSPCVFSLVPAYIGYLSGHSLAQEEAPQPESRLRTFLNGLSFVLGFSFVFISLGLAFSALSRVLYQIRDFLTKFGGLVVILFGLQMTGLIKIPLFNFDIRLRSKPGWGRSLLTSFLMGIFFSAGWSPCVGPTLGLILTLAFDQANIGQGVLLLSVYSLGMAVPFLAAAVAVGWVSSILRKHARVVRIIEVIMGVVLVVVGVLLFLGIYQKMVSFTPLFDFGL